MAIPKSYKEAARKHMKRTFSKKKKESKLDDDLCVEFDIELTDNLVEGLTHQPETAFLGAVSAAAKRKSEVKVSTLTAEKRRELEAAKDT